MERVWRDKEEGRKRPIGQPTVEDKSVQGAVARRLGAIYEQDCQECSYGLRAGRSPQHALTELREQGLGKHISGILDADRSGVFASLDHDLLRAERRHRVNDGSLRQLIGKWRVAGVSDGGTLTYPETGSPQGGVLSPMLSNIVLHSVLDEGFARDVQPRRQGRGCLLRFADAFVLGCEVEEDARRSMAVLPKRFARFRLTIHRQKTRGIAFRKPARRETADRGNDTFEFLGFTHYGTRSRLGNGVLKRKTAKKRVRRAKKALWQWGRINRHRPLKEQPQALGQKVGGPYQYYAMRGNSRALESLLALVRKAGRYWLGRRSRESYLPWDKFERILKAFPLPRPKIIHQV